MKILVVDDEEEIRELLKDWLAATGQKVFTAQNGEEATYAIKEPSSSFDLVITDTEMPQMGGVELTEWVKTNFPKIPVILMSGREEPAKHRADVFLPKPLPLKELGEIIDSLK